ncbi:lasso peptide biosynthesis B2 protein [Streptomyces sp. NPDC001493]
MTDAPAYASPHPRVKAVDFGHLVVLVDYRTGRVHCLLPATAILWRSLVANGRLAALPKETVLHLLSAGLLTSTSNPTPGEPTAVAPPISASWGSIEHTAGVARPPRGPWVAAAAALASVFAVKRAGRAGTTMNRLTGVVEKAASRCRRPASTAQITAAVAAVRRAGWLSPGRTACLEESVAVVLLLAARGLGVTWCHGVASDPVRLHAWVQTWDGEPIAEPDSTRAYTPALTIGDPHQRL